VLKIGTPSQQTLQHCYRLDLLDGDVVESYTRTNRLVTEVPGEPSAVKLRAAFPALIGHLVVDPLIRDYDVDAVLLEQGNGVLPGEQDVSGHQQGEGFAQFVGALQPLVLEREGRVGHLNVIMLGLVGEVVFSGKDITDFDPEPVSEQRPIEITLAYSGF